MNLSIGIVGLPNVGKSTLFNALLKRQQALVANYPFATIEPNVGVVPVPDNRLDQIAEITKIEEKMGSLPPLKPATVNFVDIAGLVKGASEGAGLGNKFLSHIREVSVIAHVVRAFEDGDIVREGSVGVKEDYETINTELMLADMQSAQNQDGRLKSNDPKKNLFAKIIAGLDKGTPVRDIDLTKEEKEEVNTMSFLTNKPEIVVLNVSEGDYSSEKIDEIAKDYSEKLNVGIEKVVVISAKIEAELASLSTEEQIEYLKDLGLEFSGLQRLIQKAYQELGLISFLTAGEKEVRAWTIRKGLNAQLAAGEIHTDFIKRFIKAEVVGFDNFVEFLGWKGSREKGKAMFEGRDYIVKDGDVIEFKIGT
ncbi:MAG: redox-regulated ATPase YchF [Candidatus Levybacteria bacterium]|nr:redox-regulated ATPase YchF [Candidatus Levybacteria bacterium]